ncbi:MAG: LamG domain-containing protein [Bacteroidales bacterium]|nr:LamG domain-containing protein [Bacteroidales bacterium]
MKKVLLFAASILVLGAAVSCNKDKDKEKTVPEVTVAKEALVAHFPMESATEAVKVGAGVTYSGLTGSAAFVDGFIGKAYGNTAGVNTSEAYMKLNLASSNAIKNLQSMTFTAWVKLPAGTEAKGGVLSINGTAMEPVWPALVFLFDNYNAETNEQWFNGRIDFIAKSAAMWPNSASTEYAKKDDWIQVARTYDAQSGHWANYANGVLVGEGDFLIDDKPVGAINACVASDCNAMYIGGWASRIEGKAADAWQGYFPGAIDEVRFYNQPLTEVQIAALYLEEVTIALTQSI